MPTTYEIDPERGVLIMTAPVRFADDGDCGNLDTPDAGDLNTAARECAARRGWAMEGGRYPIRSKEMHGEADLAKAIHAVGRGGGSHDVIRQHIMKRARSLGLSDRIPDNWTSSGESEAAVDGVLETFGADGIGTTTTSGTGTTVNVNLFADRPARHRQDDEEDCPEGKVRNEDGECVPEKSDDDSSDKDSSRYSMQAAVTDTEPAMFADPGFTRLTPLTVEGNRVFGHLASWNECHVGIGDRCVIAPHSATNYAYFKTGAAVLVDGSTVPIGKITLGTGHADPKLGFIPAAEHYDNTGTVVAMVNAGEDRFGVWVSGTTVPGLDEEKLAELRRSPLSGDWRRIAGNLELVAALAVNAPGFPVLRASADQELETLLAAGVVTELGEEDPVEVRRQKWSVLAETVRGDRVKALLGGD